MESTVAAIVEWAQSSLADPSTLLNTLLLVMLGAFLAEYLRGQEIIEATSSPPVDKGALALQLCKERRSVFPKHYNGEDVPRDVMERCLEAANWAPSHGKTEAWRFVVLGRTAINTVMDIKESYLDRDPILSAEKVAKAKAKFAKKSVFVREKTSCIVAICMKRVANEKGDVMPVWEEMASIACAVQNMHLVLAAHGYGGYWSSGGLKTGGWLAGEEMATLLGMTGELEGEKDQVLGLFHVGVCNDGTIDSYRARRGKLEEKVIWME